MERGGYPLPTGLHRRKIPPIDNFDGERLEVRFDNWLPMLQRAPTWNRWSEEGTLFQLAGHLRKRALLECNLLDDCERKTLSSAVEAVRERLDPWSRSTTFSTHPTKGDLTCWGLHPLAALPIDGRFTNLLLYQLMEAPASQGRRSTLSCALQLATKTDVSRV